MSNDTPKGSRVITVRLHPTDPLDPNEGRALDLYDQWLAEGHTPRSIITHALLALAGVKWQPPPDTRQLQNLIDEARHLVDDLKTIDHAPLAPAEKEQRRAAVSSTFLSNITGSAKSGQRREE